LIFPAKYGKIRASFRSEHELPFRTKEEEMSDKEMTPEERAARGKRLLIYGMFALVLVTVVSVFLTTYLLMAPIGEQGIAIQSTLIVGVIAIIACVIVWFVYTKVILKE
jgi:hypothetical protein